MKNKKRLNLLEELQSDSSKRLDLMNDKFHSMIKTVIKDSTDLTSRIDLIVETIEVLNDRIHRAERSATTGLINNKNVRNQQIADLSQRVDQSEALVSAYSAAQLDMKDQIKDLSKRVDQLIRVFDQMDIRLAKLEQVKQKDDDLDCRLTLVEESLKNDTIREKVFGQLTLWTPPTTISGSSLDQTKKSAVVRTKHPGKPKKKSARSKR